MPIKMNAEIFIKRAKELHKNEVGVPAYEYGKTTYTKSSCKTIITCPKHGDYQQTPNAHLSGHGCKKCATVENTKNSTKTLNQFIERCEKRHPGLVDYSKTTYINCKVPVTFICKKCRSEYLRDPSHMLGGRGHGCKVCNGGVKDTKDSFIDKARKTHGDLFNYDQVVYVNSLTDVKIVCPKGHVFDQTPNHHISGDGCRRCLGYYRTSDDFIALSKAKYGDTLFDYSKVCFVNMSTPVKLTCKMGHLFETNPTVHLREGSKGGCGECCKIYISESNTYTKEEWIELSIKRHSGFYNYDKTVYVSSQDNVTITCPKHGDFEQKATSHSNGAGCRGCGIEKIVESKLFSEEDFMRMFEECAHIHSNKYIYNEVYRHNGFLMLKITCDKHGDFVQRYDHHKRGHGCSKCVLQYSKSQIEWLNYLSITNGYIQHALNGGEFRIANTSWCVDGFSPETNTIYEFQGDYWHGNPRMFDLNDINVRTGTTFKILHEKTIHKVDSLKKLGYSVVEIWESEWTRAKRSITKLQRLWRKKRITPSP